MWWETCEIRKSPDGRTLNKTVRGEIDVGTIDAEHDQEMLGAKAKKKEEGHHAASDSNLNP
jgi:hypothetical protein